MLQHHFAIEFKCFETDAPSKERWYRTIQRRGFAPLYVDGDRDVLFARAYGLFRRAVDSLPCTLAGVRLVERTRQGKAKKLDTKEHVRHMQERQNIVGGQMSDEEARSTRIAIVNVRRQLEKTREEYEALLDNHVRTLVIESLRRLRAARTENEEDTDIPYDEDVEDGDVTAPGTWNCPDTARNVVGTCVYDEQEDPAHDNCLFCHQPEERK